MLEPATDELARRRALIRDVVRGSGLVGALVCVLVAILGELELALSIALGTALGVLNFALLARGVSLAIDRTVVAAQEAARTREEPDVALEPQEVIDRPRGAGGLLRVAVVVASLLAILAYSPTQPAGLAIGVILVLLAASVSAYRHERRRRDPRDACEFLAGGHSDPQATHDPPPNTRT